MADIITIDSRLKLSKEKQDALLRRRKIAALQKALQCFQCPMRCEKCGMQIDRSIEHTDKEKDIPFRFCSSCFSEYSEYIERTIGKGDPECYWHNPQWQEIWKRWIDYQNARSEYMISKEYLQIIEELNHQPIDET